MLKRLSLRARLVLGVIVVAALGLAIADVATYTSLRSFLIQRTDSSLDQDEHSFDRPGAELEGLRHGDRAPLASVADASDAEVGRKLGRKFAFALPLQDCGT